MFYMEPLDPERERMRLLELYSSMPDEQLTELAEEEESLTDTARLALKQVMERRDIRIDHAEEDLSEEIDGEFVTIREITFPGEVIVVQGVLESAGIQSRLVNVLNLPLNSLTLEYSCPTRVQVRKEDAESAFEILDAALPIEQED